MKKLLKFLLVITILLNITGCGIIKKDINIVYTSDIHCSLDNGMNYANVKAYKSYLKKTGSYVTLVDGGDFSDGGTVGVNSKGEAIIELMNETGYDIATIGNHDFGYGLDALKNNLSKAEFDIVCANIKYTGDKENPFKNIKPYVTKRYGPTKIAYIGLLTIETLNDIKGSKQNCYEDGKLVVDLYADANDPNENGDELFALVQNYIDEARQKADYVVFVAHLGGESNICMNSDQLIAFTSGIDIVLDGHDHAVKCETLQNINGEDVIRIGVGNMLNKIGLVTIKTDGTIEAEYTEYEEKDSKLQEKIDEYLIEYCY